MKRKEIYRAEVYDSEGTLAVPRGSPWDNSSLPQGGKSVTDKSAIIVKPSTAQAFETLWKRGRVLFFSAPCGFGKTAVAEALLSSREVLRLSADSAGFKLPSAEADWQILLLDDLQDMQEAIRTMTEVKMRSMHIVRLICCLKSMEWISASLILPMHRSFLKIWNRRR